ncbi:AraC family transcriptional regulator [Halioglobus maricola]|uniref:AraC family transcriptional regulator n=1 Tax=Halioglobus maricola TaxID=2601894 RepID=A0A5P9NNH8_9GAMM|nr:AraC family transcriptional regulator [Halioglobus maricola]QFU77219.1 AraC family transcriptional regulator [Halioglobus maricola]
MNVVRYASWVFLFSLTAFFQTQAQAQDAGLSAQIQDIKQQTIELNRDLFILEEELLFPANTQMAVYLSMDVGTFFALDAVKLSIDDEVVANYLYTERQVDALERGGVHRLYMGNLKAGEHEVVAVFTGRGPKGRDYRRATQLKVEKGSGAKNLELQISDAERRQQPEFRIKEW